MAWIDYNPNPYGRRTIDCTVRAFSKAMDVSSMADNEADDKINHVLRQAMQQIDGMR